MTELKRVDQEKIEDIQNIEEIERRVLEYTKKTIVVNKMQLLDRITYDKTDGDYLIFGAYNEELDKWQRVSYDINKDFIQISLHIIWMD